MFKTVLGSPIVTTTVGEKKSRATHAKETVWNEHRSILALWFMIIAESDGVGLKMLQFTTRTPTSLGRTLVFSNSWSSAPNITMDASARPSFMVAQFSVDAITDFGMKSGSRLRTLTENVSDPALGPDDSIPRFTISVEKRSRSLPMANIDTVEAFQLSFNVSGCVSLQSSEEEGSDQSTSN
ncbi:hypothetical protein G2W53_031303 [Senna tora]|uniref:Uncharacterized protein n=1 Tax=Senna tora TaxID=362788 RepID=A0A834TH88_9FABA|nr:hypothetical protein G2W53_031303 [Senna tora]